ncbi:MAG TPA: phage terminase large subunit [Sphingomicrobium sp.]|jgi:predicted phage terminase large subunit-like protein|nr:phage terminase large subunit [Sphingomicrobium sp.]
MVGLGREELRQLQRENFYAFLIQAFHILHPGEIFVPSPYLEAMCFALERVHRGECRRLLITIPPRYLKSITVSVAYSAWVLGRDPSRRILAASYASDLAAKHSRHFRALTAHPEFRRLFPRYREGARDSATEIETTLQGARRAVSLEGSATGFGADLLIIDDLTNAAKARSAAYREQVKAFYDETLYSRLNDKANAPIIAVQQRLHEADIVQHLLDKGGWEQLNLPAIAEEPQVLPLYAGREFRREKGDVLAPDYEPLEVLREIERQMTRSNFAAQWQQNPTAEGGNRIRWEWFDTYDEMLPRSEYLYVVQSWDTAYSAETGDYSVCMTFGFRDNRWHLLDLLRQRLDYPDLRRKAVMLADRWDPAVIIIENIGAGMNLANELRRGDLKRRRGSVIGHNPEGDKELRLEVQTAKLEQGLIVLPEVAPFLNDLKRELLAFPAGAHDDQVDTLTQFLHWAGGRGTGLLERDPVTLRPLGRSRPRGYSMNRRVSYC